MVSLLTRTCHLQKTVINSKFIIYIITTLSSYYIEIASVCNVSLLTNCRVQHFFCKDNEKANESKTKILKRAVFIPKRRFLIFICILCSQIKNKMLFLSYTSAAFLYCSKSHCFCSGIVISLLSSVMASSALRSGDTSR